MDGKCIGDDNPQCNKKHPPGRYNEENRQATATTSPAAPGPTSTANTNTNTNTQQDRGRPKGDGKGKKGGKREKSVGPDGKKRLPCRFFQNGTCKNTDEACPWPHRKANAEELVEMEKNAQNARCSRSPSPGASRELCRLHQQGKCTHGDNCKYSHDQPGTGQAALVGAAGM